MFGMAEEQDKLYNVSATAGGYYTKGMGGASFVTIRKIEFSACLLRNFKTLS